MKFINWKNHATLGVSVKTRNDYADYDYLDKLNKKELQWLKGFHREYINADFKHCYRKCFKRIKDKRNCYSLNNIRNRDTYNITKWQNKLFLNAQIKENSKKIEPIWHKYF
jgi:hypothetical protein